MLNKIKFLIGTFVFAMAFVATSALAAYDFGTTTIKVGSKGPAVVNVQTVVGATTDGIFGPMTKAKVMAWQASKGLTPDGLFGPLSKAKANEVIGNFPAGCTSAIGFSPTTGVKCDGSTTVTPTPVVVLNGGAGDVSVSSTSTDVENVVTEGTSNVKVLGFKATAEGSDISVTNLKVSLANVGTGATRPNRYADVVSVYMDGNKVGSADVSDFTVDGLVYSKSIALTNAIVRQGTNNKATFYVTVSALDSIDSVNMTNADWAILVNNVRFQDATGVIMTSSDTVGSLSTGKFTFTSLANSGDVKVTVSKGSLNPLTQNVAVSNTSSTNNVLMLQMKIKTAGSPVSFDSLSVTPTSTVSSITSIVGELQLRDGSSTLATIDGSSLVSGSPIAFNLDSTYTIPADTTKTLSVYAKINDEDNFLSGGTLEVDFVHAGLAPEDSNGDLITGPNYVGSVDGNVQTFLLNGAQVTYISSSYVAPGTPIVSHPGTISLKFKVSAFGSNDVNINDDASNVLHLLTNATEVDSVITSTDLTSSAGVFTVSAGDQATFTLSVLFNAPTGFKQLSITNVDGTAVSNVQSDAF